MAGQREINANFPGERLPRVLNVPQDAPYFSAFALPLPADIERRSDPLSAWHERMYAPARPLGIYVDTRDANPPDGNPADPRSDLATSALGSFSAVPEFPARGLDLSH